MSLSESESAVLDGILPELQADGYEVYRQPPRSLLPDFFRDYVPDAIAVRPADKLAIEIVQEPNRAGRKLARIAEMFEGHTDWRLKVIWASPMASPGALAIQSPSAIQARLAEVDALIDRGQFPPALLLAWAVFEALGRAVALDQFKRPQTPARLVQVLAEAGNLMPSEADKLRKLAEKRNALIHGDLQIDLRKDELTQFSATLAKMLEMLTASLR